MAETETAPLWIQRLRRFDQADTTVAKFCASEGVSQPSFYNWRRKLRGPAVRLQRGRPASFLPVELKRPAELPPFVDSPNATVTTIELPGGVRIRVKTQNCEANR